MWPFGLKIYEHWLVYIPACPSYTYCIFIYDPKGLHNSVLHAIEEHLRRSLLKVEGHSKSSME